MLMLIFSCAAINHNAENSNPDLQILVEVLEQNLVLLVGVIVLNCIKRFEENFMCKCHTLIFFQFF